MFLKQKFFSYFAVTVFIGLFLVFPNISSDGVLQGLMISANVIIPSLFPFTVCILLLIKSGFTVKNRLVNNVLYRFFGQNFDMFFAFLLSMLGGYPIGARLVGELYKQKVIDKKSADIMLMYTVNAGPAFVISAVGKGALSSYKLGVVLLFSHATSSIIIAILCSKKLKKHNCQYITPVKTSKNFCENFVESVSDASSAVIGICAFVIFFSSLNAYIDFFFENMPTIKYISYLIEVTSAVTKTHNMVFISFLLGFSGISIWCQIFAMTSQIKINFLRFAFGRLLHGTISALIAALLIKVLNIKLSAFSNNIAFKHNMLYSQITLSISLVIMLIMFFLFIYTKNSSGKIIKDVI